MVAQCFVMATLNTIYFSDYLHCRTRHLFALLTVALFLNLIPSFQLQESCILFRADVKINNRYVFIYSFSYCRI